MSTSEPRTQLRGSERRKQSEHRIDVRIWFDGGCPLCGREIELMQRLDRRDRIQFIDVSQGSDAAPDCPLDRKTLLERFHAQEVRGSTDRESVEADRGELVSGAAAFAAVWRAIPLLRPLGLLARNRFVLAVLEVGYRAFFKFRPALQKFFGWIDREPSPRQA